MATTGPLEAIKRLPMNVKAIALSLSVLVERIQSLPKLDRDDLFELMQGLKRPNSPEELSEIVATMEEILAQSPLGISDSLGRVPTGTAGLKNWKEFVAKKIRELRAARGLTQVELAEKSGLLQSHVSRLENAQHSASHQTIKKLAKALGVSISELDPSEDS
jgi:DNA-binding XRE family transcriptional regulator